ncbi:hypothetical protein RJ640_021546 [Escallonia rubra]|uniref:Thaumatin-like protein n=1 Tax=Escallonia rubra TaxID=112253 RepID=A0AA88R1K3_9ASTE|nr:hypothetical protein RJ640_021546 [Escallonia rubra]
MFFQLARVTARENRTVYSANVRLVNECPYTIWPVSASVGVTAPTLAPALALEPGESTTISLPPSWSGRIWGRTFCAYCNSTGKFACLTGDCGSNSPVCAWSSALSPVTIVEFELGGNGGPNLYVVSTLHGYNLGILMVPYGGSGGGCMATGCVSDVEDGCESETGGACNSTCFAFGESKYCCGGGGDDAPPMRCKPNPFSLYFKSGCPNVYGDVYADGWHKTKRFACALAHYKIIFCPHRTSLESSTGAVPRPSGVKIKRVIIIVLMIVNTVAAILLPVFEILSLVSVATIASVIYTALGLVLVYF